MDETYDLIRAVRDRRYKYIRNFFPERSRGQSLTYMDVGGTMRSMRRLDAEGKLTGGERQYFEPIKPVEELYDTREDPHEVENLAADPAHAEILGRLRTRLEGWQVEIGDLGMLPEPVVIKEMRPDGQKARTAAPTIRAETTEAGRLRVTLICETPGASIVYGLGDEPATERLYTGPFAVEEGVKISALACRLGYRDSPTVHETP